MSPFVLDASVGLAWCMPDERSDWTEQLLRRCRASHVVVPSLWPTEMGNALLVAERRGRIGSTALSMFLSRLDELKILVESCSFVPRSAVELARSTQLTVYDASYLELAMRRCLPLATLDRALMKAAKANSVPVL